MDEIYFLIRYTPFWAVPIVLLSLEFAYLFWLRKKKKYIGMCFAMSGFALLALIYYYWAGGPEKSVMTLARFIRFYFY